MHLIGKFGTVEKYSYELIGFQANTIKELYQQLVDAQDDNLIRPIGNLTYMWLKNNVPFELKRTPKYTRKLKEWGKTMKNKTEASLFVHLILEV